MSDNPQNVGFIGTGHIAAPMARNLARKGHKVVVSERNSEVSDALIAARLGITKGGNQAVIDASDVVFLCLRHSGEPIASAHDS